MKKKILIISVILILTAGTGFVINSKKSKKTEVKEVIVKNVENGVFTDSIDVEGDIEIKNQKDIYISKSQRVVDVFAEEGDEVKKGDILITFDPDERAAIERAIKAKQIEIEKEKINIKSYSLKISNLLVTAKEKEREKLKSENKRYEEKLKVLKIEKENLERELKSKKRDFETKQKLYEAKAISQSELDEAENSLKGLEKDIDKKSLEISENRFDIEENKRELALKESEIQDSKDSYQKESVMQKNNVELARNSIAAKQLDIENLKTDLKKTVKNVVSPVNGTVVKVEAEPNFKVNLEKSLMTIADINSQIIKADILSSDIKNVKIGQKVIIKSETMKKNIKIEGRVSKIATIATSDEGNGYSDIVVEIEIEFDAKKSGLRPGYKVNCEIILNEKPDTIYISQFAIQKEKDKKYIMVVEKNEIVKKIYVETGIENDKNIEIKNISKDTKVIMNSKDLKEGEKVKVVDKIKGDVKLKNNRTQRK